MATPLLSAVNSIIARVAAIPYTWTIPQNNPSALFQLVRLWNNQVEREATGEGYTFAKPACFIEIPPMQWTQLNLGVNTCDLKVKFHLVAQQIDAGDGTFDQNLEVITYRDLLQKYLNGFMPTFCGALSLIDEYPDYNHGSVYHWCITMVAAFVDQKGSPVEDYILSGDDNEAEITAQYVENLND